MGAFHGDIADVRLYSRPLDAAEIAALVERGKQLVQQPPAAKRGSRRQPQPDFTLTLGDRQFSGSRNSPLSWLVRLPAGQLPITRQVRQCKRAWIALF